MRTFLTLITLAAFIGTSEGQEEKTLTKDEIILQQLKDIKQTLEEMRIANKKDIDNLDARIKNLEKVPAPFTDKRKVEEQPLKRGRVEEEDEPRTRREPRLEPHTGYGSIRLKSTYNYPCTISLNGTSYRLYPGETKIIDYVPSGNFVFNVAEANGGKNETRTLKANEIYTITVINLQ